MSFEAILQALKNIIGDRLVTNIELLEQYAHDSSSCEYQLPFALVFPKSAEELSEIVKLAREEKINLVPSGGRTGLSGGANATGNSLVVSFDKMNRIVGFNALDRLLHCEAGVITAAAQNFAEQHDLTFPLDLAASGSSQIGGNIATNAGGTRVIRYGMLRQHVRGLKVVTGVGDILELNWGLKKNNAGYDLMNLFMGSEGTLGFICEAEIELVTKPNENVLLAGFEYFHEVIQFYRNCQQHFTINAFEYFTQAGLDLVLQRHTDLQAPFGRQYSFYTLLDFEMLDSRISKKTYEKLFFRLPAFVDSVLAQNTQQQRSLWAYRELQSSTLAPLKPLKFDLSVKTSSFAEFRQKLESLLANYACFGIDFGHLGDGNMHLNILPLTSPFEAATVNDLCAEVLKIVKQYGGSFSAEHGVGLLKKDFLQGQLAAELGYMFEIKKTFDPDNILNQHKIFST